MTREKDLKRRVRARMQKTGERYTTARAHLVRKEKAPAQPATPALPSNYLELTRMSDEAVAAKTGKTWPQWVATLDAMGASSMPHREIATRVYDLGVPGWWAQNVTVGYERIRGLRATGQQRGGSFTASKSRTLGVPVERLFDAFANASRRKRWLPESGLKISKATATKYVHMRWSDGARVEVGFASKGPRKAQVAIQHEGLPDAAAVQACKAYWSERFDALATLLAHGDPPA
jgi:uncharacterized protein YndB with AHSA1/START domain